MDKTERTRTCYHHACLKYVSDDYMTNQTVRERFDITDENYSMASRIIGDAIDSGLIKIMTPKTNQKICQICSLLGLKSYLMVI